MQDKDGYKGASGLACKLENVDCTNWINVVSLSLLQYSSRDVIQNPQCVRTFKNDWVRKKKILIPVESSIYILLLLLYIFLCVKVTYIYTHTLIPSTYNHASASTTMDRVPAVPDLHADIWGDRSQAHQFGLWTHCLQDVPEQVAPKGLSLWPDGHQHRHRAATCQHSPVAAGGRPGKTLRLCVFGTMLSGLWLRFKSTTLSQSRCCCQPMVKDNNVGMRFVFCLVKLQRYTSRPRLKDVFCNNRTWAALQRCTRAITWFAHSLEIPFMSHTPVVEQ